MLHRIRPERFSGDVRFSSRYAFSKRFSATRSRMRSSSERSSPTKIGTSGCSSFTCRTNSAAVRGKRSPRFVLAAFSGAGRGASPLPPPGSPVDWRSVERASEVCALPAADASPAWSNEPEGTASEGVFAWPRTLPPLLLRRGEPARTQIRPQSKPVAETTRNAETPIRTGRLMHPAVSVEQHSHYGIVYRYVLRKGRKAPPNLHTARVQTSQAARQPAPSNASGRTSCRCRPSAHTAPKPSRYPESTDTPSICPLAKPRSGAPPSSTGS